MKNISKIFIGICLILIVIFIAYISINIIKNKKVETYSNAIKKEVSSTNKIWVATFQLAWNELISKLGHDIELDGYESVLVNNLNRKKFTKEMLNENSYYVKTGIIGEELKEEINKSIKNKFNIESNVLNEIDWKNEKNKYLIYAMLNKNFTFKTPFQKFTETFGNSKEMIKYFGLEANTDKYAFEQVTALFYNSLNDFAVKIYTREGDELILYRTDIHQNFETSYNEIIQKSNEYTGIKKLQNGKDELKIPFISVNKDIRYNELYNKTIKGTSGATIEEAIQTIRFNLDNYGGNIVSEATIYGVLSFDESKPRCFDFKDTFLLYLKEKDKMEPYFALKIDNTEFLVKQEDAQIIS